MDFHTPSHYPSALITFRGPGTGDWGQSLRAWNPLKLFKLANLKPADAVFVFLPVEITVKVCPPTFPSSTSCLIWCFPWVVPTPHHYMAMSSFLVTCKCNKLTSFQEQRTSTSVCLAIPDSNHNKSIY